MTQGELMFYGGIICAVLSLIIIIIWKIILAKKRKHLKAKLGDEYFSKK